MLSERDGKAQSRKRSHPSLAQGPLLLLQQRGMQCDYFWETVTPGLVSSWLSHKPLLSPVEITMLVAPGKNAEHRMERERISHPLSKINHFQDECRLSCLSWPSTFLTWWRRRTDTRSAESILGVSSLGLYLPSRICLQSCPSSLYLEATAPALIFKYSYHSFYHSK